MSAPSRPSGQSAARVTAKLFAYLSYRDAAAALDWLAAIGFTVTTRQDGQAGTVAHAEARLGEAVVMVSSMDADYAIPPLAGRSTGSGLYVLVDDVAGMYERALSAGGRSVFAPERTDWGTERARVLDPEGYEWSFGTYEPGASWD